MGMDARLATEGTVKRSQRFALGMSEASLQGFQCVEAADGTPHLRKT